MSAGTHDINAYGEQDQLYSLATQGQQLATLLNQSMQVAVPHGADHLQVQQGNDPEQTFDRGLYGLQTTSPGQEADRNGDRAAQTIYSPQHDTCISEAHQCVHQARRSTGISGNMARASGPATAML